MSGLMTVHAMSGSAWLLQPAEETLSMALSENRGMTQLADVAPVVCAMESAVTATKSLVLNAFIGWSLLVMISVVSGTLLSRRKD
ncbi:MAG: hypothetical protein A3E23_05005 [Burkholderiales bacterium RIFCSPHIGHO2_12_FULL_65_48]|nr:MAG: hypothetical protein A3C40_03940 [Burkholderiales bacterium RIFCSPHIGHO2_02_FULL_64_19]OGB25537.1 MAG: hypothetical protein A3E23_05005 [Burkholderiales bacterium RIFCSPHIGHO2_12_FULL_65_48]OGB53305.1 MAG: hypothetical protein A3F71_06410 [Burkholderiales bacterium RIFCSPLOWO2_12_FULL_64_33]